ncbi:MAG: MIP/aquaporin family protein [Phycisphaeraceae bacterium]
MAKPLRANQLIAEVFGTFCLVFAGCGAMVVDEVTGGAIGHAGIALTWGLIVAALIYSIGDVSGAHINPAVTVGFWLAKQFPGYRVLPYVTAQVIGAFLAAGMLRVLFPTSETLGATVPHDMGMVWQSFVLEVLLTLILMFVILCVAIGSKERGLMAGIAIGATVGLEAMFAGPICGASMNPARSLAPAIVSLNADALQSLWAYLVATLLGASLAVPLWRVIYSADHGE